MTLMHITEIYVHPIKSVRGIKLDECLITKSGFQYDRMYMMARRVPDSDVLKFVTQRQEPLMALIETSIENDQLILSHGPSGSKLALVLDQSQIPDDLPVVKADVWGENVVAVDYSSIVPGWKEFIVSALGPKYSDVILLAQKVGRVVKKMVPQEVLDGFDEPPRSNFQDYYPGHLICTASLENLQQRVNTQQEGIELTPRRFRPNIVVETDEPFIEDDWASVKVGDHIWNIPTVCPRCPIPTVDPDAGAFEKSKQPTGVMKSFRLIDAYHPGSPCFGVNMLNLDSGYKVKVGDKIEVLKTMDRPMPGDL